MLSLFDKNKWTDVAYWNVKNELKPHHTRIKLHIDQLYNVTRDYLDKGFENRFPHEVASRYSEMYFTHALRSRYALSVTHVSDKGPDLLIKDFNCWAEFVTATNGNEGLPNSMQLFDTDKVIRIDANRRLLRLTNVIETKNTKLNEYIADDIVKSDEPYVLFVSTGWLRDPYPSHPVGGVPDYFGAILPFSAPKIVIGCNGRLKYDYRPGITKIGNDELIKNDGFLSGEMKQISAVVFSYLNPGTVVDLDSVGADFMVLHNPTAANPLPMGFLATDEEYSIELHDDGFTVNRAGGVDETN